MGFDSVLPRPGRQIISRSRRAGRDVRRGSWTAMGDRDQLLIGTIAVPTALHHFSAKKPSAFVLGHQLTIIGRGTLATVGEGGHWSGLSKTIDVVNGPSLNSST